VFCVRSVRQCFCLGGWHLWYNEGMTPLPPDEVAHVFGQQLHQLRTTAGFTQGDLAVACGLSVAVIGYYEQTVRRPLPETVALLGGVLEARVPGAAARLALAWLVSAGRSAGADLDLLGMLRRWADLDPLTQQQVLNLAFAGAAPLPSSSLKRQRVRSPKPSASAGPE